MSSAKALVAQATRDNANPPSGYQLDQLTKASLSSITDCQEIETALASRLGNKSPNVKWKALRVVRHLCMHGHVNVKKAFQRHTDILRQCANFSGAPHPLHGDTQNERVRVSAKEAMNALFSTTTENMSHGSMEPKKKMTGFGSHDVGGMGSGSRSGGYSGGAGGGANSSSFQPSSSSNYHSGYQPASGERREDNAQHSSAGTYNAQSSGKTMIGFGNPAFENQPQAAPSLMDRMKKAFEPVGGRMSRASTAFSSGRGPQSQGHGQGFRSSSYSGGGPGPQFSPPRTEVDVKPAHADSNFARKRGQVGGVWATSQSRDDVPVRDSSFEHSRSSEVPKSSGWSDAPSVPASLSRTKSDGQLENRLISCATASGGVKTAPTREQLDAIVQAYDSLDLDLVLQLLNECLENGHWQSQLKAMHVIDVLMSRDVELVQEFFLENPDSLIALVSSTTRSVRQKANKITTELGLSNGSRPASAGSERGREHEHERTPVSVAEAPTDLLDLAALNVSESQPQPANDISSGFDFLTENTSEEQPPVFTAEAPSKDLFSSINVRSQSAASSRSDPLSFLTESIAPTSAPAVAPEPSFDPLSLSGRSQSAVAPPSNSAFDFLRSSPSPSPSQPSSFTSLLNPSQSQPQAQAQSGFSFLNQQQAPSQAKDGVLNAVFAAQDTAPSARTINPFADAVKPTRKPASAPDDSFAFVEAMMKTH